MNPPNFSFSFHLASMKRKNKREQKTYHIAGCHTSQYSISLYSLLTKILNLKSFTLMIYGSRKRTLYSFKTFNTTIICNKSYHNCHQSVKGKRYFLVIFFDKIFSGILVYEHISQIYFIFYQFCAFNFPHISKGTASVKKSMVQRARRTDRAPRLLRPNR